jgi:hypothetical protein
MGSRHRRGQDQRECAKHAQLHPHGFVVGDRQEEDEERRNDGNSVDDVYGIALLFRGTRGHGAAVHSVVNITDQRFTCPLATATRALSAANGLPFQTGLARGAVRSNLQNRSIRRYLPLRKLPCRNRLSAGIRCLPESHRMSGREQEPSRTPLPSRPPLPTRPDEPARHPEPTRR